MRIKEIREKIQRMRRITKEHSQKMDDMAAEVNALKIQIQSLTKTVDELLRECSSS